MSSSVELRARTFVEADGDAIFGAKSADPTSDSDSTSNSAVVEEDESGAKRSRLADEWSESESDDDSDDDGGDDFESTSDDDGQKPCLKTSILQEDMAAIKDGSHSSVLPAHHIVSIQCQISRASSREKNPFLLGLLAAVLREETLSHARRAGVPVRTRSRFDYTCYHPGFAELSLFVEGCGS